MYKKIINRKDEEKGKTVNNMEKDEDNFNTKDIAPEGFLP